MKTTDTHTKPSLTRKAISYTVMAAMLHASVAPAIASTAQKKQHAQQTQAANSAEDAVAQMMEMAAKHELNLAFIKDAEATRLATRSVITKMVDGVKQVFVDSPETQAIDAENNSVVSRFIALEAQMHNEHASLMRELTQQIQTYQDKNMPASVFADQKQLIDELNKRHQTLKGLIHNLKTAKGDSNQHAALATLNKQLKDWQPKVAHTDMDNLPWGTPKNDVREPIVAEQSDINKVSYPLQTSYQTDSRVFVRAEPVEAWTKTRSHFDKLSANGLSHQHVAAPHSETLSNTAVGQWRETEYKIGNYLLNKQNPPQSPFNKGGGYFIQKSNAGALNGMTAAGNWPVLKALPKEVQDADLAENQDVQINDDIKALAKQLDHSPARIYKWVHDNIEFVPTYGSIQGSAYTLDTKRGNSADTASLLIALLRASKVPARYVYGTVDIPAKFAMDWVGGVNNIDAAQNLMGQGGIPSIALMDGAVPKYLRLEHVWVEANVDYIGSRGALSADKTTNNQKQWIPLDASYKSYTRTQGIDLATAVPFDAEKLLKDAQEGAEVNESEGSVKNLNQQAINTAIEDYQARVKTYLEQNNPNATVGDVLGTSTINEYKSDTLAPMLPYAVKTVVSDYHELPENMRHYFVVNVYQDASERRNTVALGENPSFHVKIPTTDLQGKPLALSFKPASTADEDKLIAVLPEFESDGTLDEKKLPRSFPSSINMQAEITLAGETMKAGNNYKFGHELYTRMGYINPQTNVNLTYASNTGLVDKVVRAGEYHAIGYDMQGMGEGHLRQTLTQLEKVETAFKDFQTTGDDRKLATLDKHDYTGSMLQAVVQSYFTMNDAQDFLATRQSNIVANRFMSFGTFHTYIQPIKRYGVIFGSTVSGYQMDIDRLMRTAVSKNNVISELAIFNRVQGVRQSAFEHQIPEFYLNEINSPDKNVEGTSAVKSLQIAQQEGQTIYLINNTNKDTFLPKLSHGGVVMDDIRNALSANKEVMVSEKSVTNNGWSGTGYIIIDPLTGSGAYLIAGGVDGGSIRNLAKNFKQSFSNTYFGASSKNGYGDIPPRVRPSWFKYLKKLAYKGFLSQITKPAKFSAQMKFILEGIIKNTNCLAQSTKQNFLSSVKLLNDVSKAGAVASAFAPRGGVYNIAGLTLELTLVLGYLLLTQLVLRTIQIEYVTSDKCDR